MCKILYSPSLVPTGSLFRRCDHSCCDKFGYPADDLSRKTTSTSLTLKFRRYFPVCIHVHHHSQLLSIIVYASSFSVLRKYQAGGLASSFSSNESRLQYVLSQGRLRDKASLQLLSYRYYTYLYPDIGSRREKIRFPGALTKDKWYKVSTRC